MADVAAHLVAGGFHGVDLVALASLSADASGREVDPLLPGTLADIDAPDLTIDAAAEVFARLVAMAEWERQNHPIVLTLAGLAPELDNPGGLINDAYQASGWVDCDCCVDSQALADADAWRLGWPRCPRWICLRASSER